MRPMKRLLFLTSALACVLLCPAADAANRLLVSANGRAYVLDEDLSVSQEVNGCGNLHRAFYHGNWMYYSNGSLWRVRRDGTGARECVYRAEKGEAVFGFEVLPDGGLLVADNAADRVLEFAPLAESARLPLAAADARVSFSVNAADAAGKLPNAHTHLRMIRKTPQGTYLVCAAAAGFVREYDRTGRLVWEQEAKPLAFEAVRLANGNTLVAHLTALTEFTPDHRAVWTFTPADAPELKLKNLCGIFFRPDGRLVVGTYANGEKTGTQTTTFVLDRGTRKVVWRYASGRDRNMMSAVPLPETSRIRRLNGLCNTITLKGDVNAKRLARLMTLYRALEIPETRFHDVVSENPGLELVDVSRIFPLFHADENDPRNYNFGPTDLYLARAREVGGELEFRFGEQIEHQRVQFQVRPPKDIAKWARICVNIARHYNDGWADGFRWNIRRFSVWEEPDNDRLLTGATKGNFKACYFKMYAALARGLKAAWPEAQVGGPNTMGPGDAFRSFVRFCADEKLPLDFAAYTCYQIDPLLFADISRSARKILDDAGFVRTELEISEWHAAPATWEFTDPRYASSLVGPDSFAYAGAVLTVMQDAPVDRMFYYAAHVNNWSMIAGVTPRPVYYVFRTFAEIARGERVPLPPNPEKGVYVLASRRPDGTGVMMLSLQGIAAGTKSIALPEKVWVTDVRRIVDEKEPKPVAGWRVEAGRFILPAEAGSAVYRLAFEREM